MNLHNHNRIAIALLFFASCFLSTANAATFPGTACVQINDTTGGLSWSNTVNALTVSCWFKISVPSDQTISQNMTILVNRKDGDETSIFAYLVRYNVSNGNVEFLSKGASGTFTQTLIEKPYLDRWYHMATVRLGEGFTSYVDGRQVPAGDGTAGNAATTSGVSIGGWGSGKYFYGEIQEVAIYQTQLDSGLIRERMFKDQAAFANIKGYYKLGYTTNTDDRFRNFAASPPSGTDGTSAGSGTIEFEETDREGEQSTFDSRRNGGENAIAPLSGSFSWDRTVFARPVPVVAFDFRIGYSSGIAFSGAEAGTDPYERRILGRGWRQTFDARIIPEQISNQRRLLTWDGSIETWTKTNNVFKTQHKEYRGELNQLPSGDFEWVTPERVTYRFRDPTLGTFMDGRLYEIADANSNLVRLAWNAGEGVVTQITDTVGAKYNLNYDLGRVVLTNLAFQGWSVNFAYDSQNRLTNVFHSGPATYANVNTRWAFAYDVTSGLLNSITDPRGNTNTFVSYDKYGRVTNTVDAIGRSTKTEYGVPSKRQIRRTDPGNFQWIETYDRKGRLLSQADPLGNATSYTYDDRGNRVSITEPLGWKTTFSYDDRANVLSSTNALGQVRTWTYHSFYNKPLTETDPLGWVQRYDYDAAGNLTNHWDDLGSLVRYTYTTNGLVQTSTDANGNISTFTYNADGFLASKTDPAANITGYAHNEVGWVLAETNALNQVTAYSYNVNGQVVQRVDPLFRTYTSVYDPNGNLIAQSDAKGLFTTNVFDAANQRTQMVDRVSSKWNYAYTSRGEVAKITDPLNNVVSNAYDSANRLVKVFDPLGNAVQTEYDANGKPTALIDKLGQRWTKKYDRLNRVTAESDPLGNTKQTSYDAAGRIKTITTPNGFPSTHDYDGRGRLKEWKDAESYLWKYAYDGNGNIVDITDALNGHYIMAYSNRNERVMERNQDNFEWRYRYDKLLRPDQQTDPNGTVRTIVYDDGSRIDYVSFSTGRVDDHQYDDNNNLTLLSRSRPGDPPTSSTFIYDNNDRIKEYTDTFGKKVKYSYDALGRATSLTYPDNKVLIQNYDALSRLTNQVDWASRKLDYAYDKANRLVGRTYPNGVTQTNDFDNAGRIGLLAYNMIKTNILSNTITNGLVGHWKFDEGSGTTANDSSGQGNSGVITGATWTTGRLGTALSFDGVNNNRVSIPNSVSLNPTTNITLALWVKADDWGLNRRIITKGFAGVELQYTLNTQDGVGIRLGLSGVTGGDIVTPALPTTNQWHHLAGVYDGLAVRIYVDGLVVTQRTASGSISGGSSNLVIGSFSGSTDPITFFDGGIDDVRIYNRGLASNEVQQIYQSGQTNITTNPYIALQYAYDRNGNKTSGTEQGTFDWPQPAMHDETAQYTASGRLIDKTDNGVANNNWTYAYDPSGNMTNAVGAGQSFAFTYDEDNRVLSLGWEAGITSKNIQNRYDALGRRISRKVDGVETRYALDLQGNMERILCDYNSSGQITAYYIHGPDLAYKVTPGTTEAITCYHADAQANIIALTDGGGTNVAQYAYTPYGRSLGSSVSGLASGNPYLFVGSQGVMEELPGLYFMRARYYSADTGTFLSTDPVKHIGPTWRPAAYSYADGNPLAFKDPGGESPTLATAAIGAGIGGLISGGMELFRQVVVEHKPLKEVNWSDVGVETVKGMITGGTAGLTLGGSFLERVRELA